MDRIGDPHRDLELEGLRLEPVTPAVVRAHAERNDLEFAKPLSEFVRDGLRSLGVARLVGGAEVARPAAQVIAQITAPDGTPVRTIDLGPQPAGVATFVWDGMNDDGDALPAGEYRFDVVAIGEEGPEALGPLAARRVDGVTRGEQGTVYRLENGLTIPSDRIAGAY